MTRKEKVGVVEAYLRGLGSRDFRNVSFASDVTYEKFGDDPFSIDYELGGFLGYVSVVF